MSNSDFAFSTRIASSALGNRSRHPNCGSQPEKKSPQRTQLKPHLSRFDRLRSKRSGEKGEALLRTGRMTRDI